MFRTDPCLTNRRLIDRPTGCSTGCPVDQPAWLHVFTEQPTLDLRVKGHSSAARVVAMPKRKNPFGEITPLQRKTHVGFEQMATQQEREEVYGEYHCLHHVHICT